MSYPSTLLVNIKDRLKDLDKEASRSDIETEVRKADLDLLDKINRVASSGAEDIFVTTGSVNKTVQLPALSSSQGLVFRYYKADSGSGFVVIQGSGNDKIGLQATQSIFTLYTKGDSVTLIGTPTVWVISSFVSVPFSYTPSFQGFGTVTSVTFIAYRSSLAYLTVFPAKFTAGTTTAVEARIGLPNSLVSDSTLVPSLTLCGTGTTERSSATFFGITVLIGSGLGYVNLGVQSSVQGGATAATGSSAIGTGALCEITCSVPINTWNA